MKAVARAQKERSLEMFKTTLQDYQDRELEASIATDRLLQSFTRIRSSGRTSRRYTTRFWSRTFSVSLSRTRLSSCRGLLMRLAKVVMLWRRSE